MKFNLKYRVWNSQVNCYSGSGSTFHLGKQIFEIRPDEEQVIEMFTGVTDIKGNDIYVGDIVKDTLGNVFTIKYNFDFKANFLYPVKDEEKFMAIYPDIWLVKLGNINENKELLE